MKSRLFITLCISICLFAVSCRVSPDQKNRYDFSPLDSIIQGWVGKGYYPGASICVVRNDSVIFRKNYGTYTPETKVYVASAGKWVAASVIGAVVDRSGLAWDDPVEKWLPEFQGDAKGKILLRQLLSHTSGVRPYLPEPRVDNYNHLDSAILEILPLDTVFAPGSRFEYGGLAMQIAGRMSEVAMGKEFETLFQELLAQPLGMENSHFTPVNTDGGHAPMLGGGLCTTLNDYMRFLSMIYHDGVYGGKQIISAETIKEMQADQVKGAVLPPDNYVEKALGQSHNGIYGLGEWRELADKKTGEAWQISSPGWAGAYPWINKRDKEGGFSSFFGSPVISRTVSEIVRGNPLVIKQGRVTVGNASLYYEEAGQGEPLIFIHGHSLDHRMWDEQFSVLAKKYRVVRYDLRGYGISSSQTEDEQFLHAEDLVALMDSLHIDKAHIVGLSLGGFVTADMLAYFPDRMLSAFLASGNIRKSKGPSEPMTKEEAAKRDEEIAALKKKGIDAMKKEWFEGLMKSGGTQRERMRIPLWQMIDEWEAWQPLHKEVRVVAGLDAIEKLKETHPSVPTLIVEGRSPDNRFSKNPQILEYLPNGKLKVLDDCGHMMNMERPEEFNAALVEFLEGKE